MLFLKFDNLEIELCHSGEYYQGTRFDRTAVFRRIVMDGYVYADEWFAHYDPLAHDAVCGPSEEFVTVNWDGVKVGEVFPKVGVGLLRRPDDAPYDWFRLYDIVEQGKWIVKQDDHSVTFTHLLKGYYRYSKTITLTSSSTFEISHNLTWENELPLSGHTYNHNFFTFNGTEVGKSRQILFPFTPAGDWRSEYDNVFLTPDGIRFTAPITQTPSVYMGNLHAFKQIASPYSVRIKEENREVSIQCDTPVSYYVFWSNPKVACIEPYMPIELSLGQTKQWTIFYSLI